MICNYYIFKKCGVKGFLAFIPIYNKLIEYRIFYSSFIYLLNYSLNLVKYYILSNFILNATFTIKEFNLYKLFETSYMKELLFFYFLILIISIIIYYINIKECAYISLSFNKGTLFAIILYFFNIIGLSILAFSDCQYYGNIYKRMKGFRYVQ